MGAISHPLIGAAYKAGIKGGADLVTPFFGPRKNQYVTETCFAHSLASGLEAARAAKGHALTFSISPQTIAALVYGKEQRSGAPPAGGWPGLQDLGAELQDAADVVGSWGVAPMGPAVSDSNSDVGDGPYAPNSPGAAPFPEADGLRVIEGSANLIDGEYQIPVDANVAEVIAASLDALVPVWVGGLVGDAYEALAANDVAQPCAANDPGAGGHAQVIGGYRVVSGTGEIQLLTVNSWGYSWANNGTVWCSTAWARALWQAWPLAVAS
jgi:hypothetical protein